MRNRSTVEFLGIPEWLKNENFNYLEFEVLDREARRNSFVLVELGRALGKHPSSKNCT
jgi:hypothetical protein